MTRSRRRRGDGGSGTVLVLGVCAVALGLLLALLGLGAAVTTRHRAEAAADLAALAGADVVLGRAPGQPCVRAGEVLAAHGATASACAVEADGTVQVTATVPVPGHFAALGTARATARAGAQPAAGRVQSPSGTVQSP